MSLHGKLFYFTCEDSALGNFEDSYLKYFNWKFLVHTDDGDFIAPNTLTTNHIFQTLGLPLNIQWSYDVVNPKKIKYDFYTVVLGNRVFVNFLAYDELFIQDNGDLDGYAYRFGQLAFRYTGKLVA